MSVFDVSKLVNRVRSSLRGNSTDPTARRRQVMHRSDSERLASTSAGSLIKQLSSGHSPATQSSGAIVFHSQAGKATISQLQHLSKEGAIVLHSLGSDGTFESQVLSRVPDTIVDAESTITPCGDADPGTTRFVINRRRRSYYHLGMLDEPVLPAIVERATSSIPLVTQSRSHDPRMLPWRPLGQGRHHRSLLSERGDPIMELQGSKRMSLEETWESRWEHRWIVNLVGGDSDTSSEDSGK